MGRRKVLATYFEGARGYRGDNLQDGGYWYAELSKNPAALDFSALGNLPHLHKLKVSYNGKSGVARKGDVGAGGRNHPQIDLHITLARHLGFTSVGLGYVYIENA